MFVNSLAYHCRLLWARRGVSNRGAGGVCFGRQGEVLQRAGALGLALLKGSYGSEHWNLDRKPCEPNLGAN